MNRQEICQEVVRLYGQGATPIQIYKQFPQVNKGTIQAWIYRGERPWPEPNLTPSPALSYILGVLYGDGYTSIASMSRNHIVGLTAKDQEFVIAFHNAMKKIDLSPYKITVVRPRYFRSHATSKKFVDWFRKLNFVDMIQIAGYYPIEFIRGFYDSEGSLSHRSKNKNWLTLLMDNTKLETLRFVEQLLSKFGFRNSIFKVKVRGNRKQLYRLWLLGGTSEVIRFLKLIQPSIQRKNVWG